MQLEHRKIAGLLILVGGVQCVLSIIISEALHPGYSTSANWISDLGVGPSANIFNSSLIVLGVLCIAGAYFIQQASHFKGFPILLAVAGVGAVGVGIFTEHFNVLHTVFSSTLFLFAGLCAIASYWLQKPPLSHVSIVLGVFTLSALVLTGSGVYLGLGKGGMERMIAYPAILWLVGFGSHLLSTSDCTV